MRLKEIKPGMSIKCDTREENDELLKELESLGYKWGNYRESPRVLMGKNRDIIFNIYKKHIFGIGFSIPITHTFKDLIIKDELTNEEVIELFLEVYRSSLLQKRMFGCVMTTFELKKRFAPQEIVEKLIEYKKSKEIKVVSKEEYEKVASDKLDELYPKGWKVEE